MDMITAWKSLTITGLVFVNLAVIHAPLMTINTIAALLLVGFTFSFSRINNSVIKIDLFHAALPTYATKDLLFSPRHIFNALVTTLQQAFPQAKVALMILQSGMSVLSAVQAFFTIVVKIRTMVMDMKKTGSPMSSLQLTDLIELVVQCMSAYALFSNAASQA
jgi:hypothetical protein